MMDQERRSQVKAVVSATVSEILDIDLFIEGIHKVKINDELETIRIAGIVRPRYFSGNSVFLSDCKSGNIGAWSRGCCCKAITRIND